LDEVNAMPQVSGKLISIDNSEQVDGTIEFMLCGYGPQFPRAIATGSDVGSICAVKISAIAGGAGGTFTVGLVGNDVITPPGTYYTVTIKNANGDAVQCNAYVFLESHGNYDLDFETPFDPALPMPPLPPLIYNQLLLIPASATPNFPGDQYTAWGLTLNQDVTSSTLSGIKAGNLYTFLISQTGGGGWKFKWPPVVLDAMPVNPEAGGFTIQTFVAISNNGPLLPISAGTWFHP
jgi:hypothetical protein